YKTIPGRSNGRHSFRTGGRNPQSGTHRSLSFFPSHLPGIGDTAERLRYKRAGSRHVHAYEAASGSPECQPVVQPDTGLIRQKTEQLVVLHTQPAQVEPHKIGAFRYIGSRLRQTPGKKTYGKLHI